MKKKVDWIELFILLLPILFISVISVWHAFGVAGVQPWKAIYFLSNHLFIIYLCTIIYFTVGIPELQKIMKYLAIPYFYFKIIYQLLIWFKVDIGSDKLWEHIWSIILIVVLLIGSILLWKNSRKTS